MQWSQLKKRLEANFTEKLKGRVQIWQTRYRHAHDDEGEAWITLDGNQILSKGSLSFVKKLYEEKSPNCDDFDKRYSAAEKSGFVLLEKFNAALFESLNRSIDEIMLHPYPFIRGLGLLDKRYGVRRLEKFEPAGEDDFVVKMYKLRCSVESLSVKEPNCHSRERGNPDNNVVVGGSPDAYWINKTGFPLSRE